MRGFIVSDKAMMLFPRERTSISSSLQMEDWMIYSSKRWPEIATEHRRYQEQCKRELAILGLELDQNFYRSHIFAWNMKHRDRKILVDRILQGYQTHNNGTTIFNYMKPLWSHLIYAAEPMFIKKNEHNGGIAAGKGHPGSKPDA